MTTHFLRALARRGPDGLFPTLCGKRVLASEAKGSANCQQCWIEQLRIECALVALLDDSPSLTDVVMVELQRADAVPVRES
jgi:hypothetical protein